MDGLSERLADALDSREGLGIYELATMLRVENVEMLRALWDAERRGAVVPMVIEGLVYWFLVPGDR